MNRFILLLWGCSWLAPHFLLSQITGGDGKLLRIETYRNYTATDSTAFQRTRYDYPIPTQRIETNDQFEEGLWVPQTRFNYTFDALGRTIETILERYDPGAKAFYPQIRTQSFPRGNSLTQVDSVFTYNWSDGQQAWEVYITQRNRFNAQNQLVETETAIAFSGQSFRNRDLSFYDANGNNTRVENYSFLNGQFTLSGFTNRFFENNLLSGTTSYSAVPPNDSLPLSRSVNTYAANKLLSSAEGFSWDPISKEWKQSNSSVYTYTAEQQLQSLLITVIINGEAQKSRVDLYYTTNGSIVREENFKGSGTPTEWVLDTKKFYYYDLASSLHEPKFSKKLFKISPNPSTDEVRLDLPLGASFQVFNAGGQLQASGLMKGQKTVDIRNWPSGMYWVVARQEAEILLGKIIKP
ncbi:T9SS type A sorting domain-containing protein [Haliscomenobacter sp.]|uniref:T9SS type A sorting domain-containing protein n=1 Tax=Haliscomenobacter sp. TaxID=2717303 RepID=UPI003594381E